MYFKFVRFLLGFNTVVDEYKEISVYKKVFNAFFIFYFMIFINFLIFLFFENAKLNIFLTLVSLIFSLLYLFFSTLKYSETEKVIKKKKLKDSLVYSLLTTIMGGTLFYYLFIGINKINFFDIITLFCVFFVLFFVSYFVQNKREEN